MKRIEVLEIVNAAMKANMENPEIEVSVEVNRSIIDDEIRCEVNIWNRYEEGVDRKIFGSLSNLSTIENEEGETRTATAEDLMNLIEKYANMQEPRIYETTDIKAVAECAGDTETQNAVLVHEKADKFGNGDCILFGYLSEDLKNDSDVLAALQSETPESNFSIDESGIYHA